MSALTERQRATAESLASEVLQTPPGPSALWNLTGVVGSGKSTVLRAVAEPLRAAGQVPVVIAAPSGEADAAPIALLEAAGQLKAAGFLNGEIHKVSDPSTPWHDKVDAVTSVFDANYTKIVILCDDPTHWYRHQAEPGEELASWGRRLAEWTINFTRCRRIISGYVSEVYASRGWREVPRLKDSHEFIESHDWGKLAPFADKLDRSLNGKQNLCVGEVKILVALYRCFDEYEVPQQAKPDMSRMLELLLDSLETDQSCFDLCQSLARLSVSRTYLSEHFFQSMLAELEPIDADLVTHCLTENCAEGRSLHPLVRYKVIERARTSRNGSVLPWRLPTRARKFTHRALKSQYTTGSYRAELESLHHDILGGSGKPRKNDHRLRFVEQLHAIGRTISRDYHEHERAVRIFDFALSLDPQDSYSHHYKAYNLDWLAREPSTIEQNYVRALELRPTHPRWWSRWISYLATRGEFDKARKYWGQALGALSIGDDSSPDWHYQALHRWVARWLLHWAELDFAEEVLEAIPARLSEDDPSIRALRNLLTALRAAQAGAAVFPLTVPADNWWSPNGHTGLPLAIEGEPLHVWKPARVEAVEESDGTVYITYAERPSEGNDEIKYYSDQLSREQVTKSAHKFTWKELRAGSFIELAYYGMEDQLRIGLHTARKLEPGSLLPLLPPADRWYNRAVEDAW